MEIDRTTYDKAAKYPPRWGYQSRGGAVPSSVIIHTTNNKRATAFETEARYLYDSNLVSAHYLIGKDGTTIEFLSPLKWQAWHAGNCTPAFLNPRSIGIEHHVSVGEPWTVAQRTACTELVQSLMRAYGISAPMVETHRAVALPKGRKSDPEGWSDSAFYAWRATLAPVSLPSDPWAEWGPIGKPVGETQGYAVPRAWLVNKRLGACIWPETYSGSGEYSITEFVNGVIIYLRRRNVALVEMFV